MSVRAKGKCMMRSLSMCGNRAVSLLSECLSHPQMKANAHMAAVEA
jgi:hypothetical protein